jgi:hypothetical protein
MKSNLPNKPKGKNSPEKVVDHQVRPKIGVELEEEVMSSLTNLCYNKRKSKLNPVYLCREKRIA